ncbi:MAG: hypothetical protein RLZZ335_937 [Bacteroidota bacterium]
MTTTILRFCSTLIIVLSVWSPLSSFAQPCAPGSDVQSPQVLLQQTNIYLNGNGIAVVSPATVIDTIIDNCSNFTYLLSNATVSQQFFNCTNIGVNQLAVQVRDQAGNVTTSYTQINVIDSIIPEVFTRPVTLALNHAGLAFLSVSQVNNGSRDNCGIASMTLSRTHFSCADLGMQQIQLLITDYSGNSATATSNITIIDTTPPQLTARSITIELNEFGVATIQPSDIDNGSYDNCSLSLSVSPSIFSCGQIGTNTVFLTGTDGVNTRFISTSVQIVDNRAPRVVTRNVFAYLNSSGEAFITPAMVDSASTDNCGITNRSLSTNYFNCQTSAGNNTVTLFVRDAAGNLGSGTATVTLLDTFVPFVLPANMPSDVVLGECQAAYFYDLPIPTDNCLGTTVRLISGLPPGSTFPIGVRSNVFEIRDVFGNTDTVRFNVTVVESAPLVPYVPPGRTFCATDAPFDLTSLTGIPGTGRSGYNISGGGMRNPTVFDPAQAPLGNFNLRYDYTDSFGCVTTGYIPMEVLPAPSEPLIERVTATLLKAPSGYSAYQWYRYGGAIPGATSSTYDVVLTGVYEVRVMNGAGCFRMSPPYGFGVGVGVDELNQGALNIYPNPSGGVFQVDYTGRDQESAEIQVFDMSGRRMNVTQMTPGTAVMDLSHLAPGRYLVHLRASDKSSFQSIVINSNR